VGRLQHEERVRQREGATGVGGGGRPKRRCPSPSTTSLDPEGRELLVAVAGRALPGLELGARSARAVADVDALAAALDGDPAVVGVEPLLLRHVVKA
jgi:hypothetical protein